MRLRGLVWRQWLVSTMVLIAIDAWQVPARAEAPRVLIVLDKSSSMLDEVPGGAKWDVATGAVSEIVAEFANGIDFGLMLFPQPDDCGPGRVVVDCAPDSGAAIDRALEEPPPEGGNFTPLAESLRAAGEYEAFQEEDRARIVLVITDGWQWCFPYDATRRFDPATAALELQQAGVDTYVVGFGAEVDPLTLNHAAVAGGTAVAGCDRDGETPGENNCYYQAEDADALIQVLGEIAETITDEVCDGQDNDGDGAIDNGFDEDSDGYTTCAQGGPDCNDANAGVNPAQDEVCDEIDNNCDGEMDVGCGGCAEGESRRCGDCESGVQQCTGGAWGECTGAPAPAEICDGLDNDCDGWADEEVTCPEAGSICFGGRCSPVNPQAPDNPVPPPGEPQGNLKGGCGGCRQPGGSGWTAPYWLTVAAAVALLIRRRRRS